MFKKILAILILGILLTACGQQGPLYLTDGTNTSQQRN